MRWRSDKVSKKGRNDVPTRFCVTTSVNVPIGDVHTYRDLRLH